MTQPELEALMVQRVSEILKIPPSEVRVDEEFANLGLNSVHAVTLSGELEERLQLSIEPHLVFEYPTIASLAEYLLTL
ncbi:MAG: acyl carrier protein [Candidatus Eremiobacteraeota bacterium]|nr:acyl carrier protein [Candidatus Eremiobacteraeota bacterium]